MIIDSKSNLAKLMATENISVEQRNVPTACFMLKERTLIIPTLKQQMSTQLYDLFIGHEVGHALNTPEKGWHDSIIDVGVNRSILNVCEDARIEKLINRKYPGLKISFIKAYKELLEQNFFGIKDININSLRIIDKINLFMKCGSSLGIKFDETEQYFVDKVAKTETFEEVVEVAKELQAFMKEENEKVKLKLEEDEDGDIELEDSEEFLDEDGYSDNSEDDNQGEFDYYDQPLHDKQESGTGSKDDDEIRSITDDNFRENEKQLYDTQTSDKNYCTVPDINSDKFIVDFKDIYAEIKSNLADSKTKVYPTGYDHNITNEEFLKFKSESIKVVSYLAKEFELKKNADQLKRASTAKTGELDMNKIYSYKFNDDIFKKITNVPNGKSHGLVLFLDWSASMDRHLHNTIKQLLTLVMFCKKVMIPFEVYAFSDAYGFSLDEFNQDHITYKNKDIMLRKVKLMNILSNRMSASDFTFAASALLSKIYEYKHIYQNFGLSSTPLNETVLLAMDIIPKFQKRNKLQIVNTVFLTDGEGHHLSIYKDNDMTEGRSYADWDSIILTDPKTRASTKVDYTGGNTSKSFLYLLKQRTGCNVIGYRIATLREASSFLYQEFRRVNFSIIDPMYSEFKKNKALVVKSSGFDEYYLIKSDKLEIEEEELNISNKKSIKSMVSAFKKYTKGQITNKVILNRFVELIS